MDTLTFITKMTEYLAWPVAVCVLTYLIRDDIGKAIASIRKLKHKDTEIDFGKELKEASEAASQSTELVKSSSDDAASSELAMLSPRGAGYPARIPAIRPHPASGYRTTHPADAGFYYWVSCISADRKSTRLNSSHRCISYAVFCLKKKTNNGDERDSQTYRTEPE